MLSQEKQQKNLTQKHTSFLNRIESAMYKNICYRDGLEA